MFHCDRHLSSFTLACQTSIKEFHQRKVKMFIVSLSDIYLQYTVMGVVKKYVIKRVCT